ncbi:hypothetical protein HDU98_005391 [Podochytrium sp. JEL0797]|nr:hypothetical protein HDU98_005391 [Podochytrium sp. JEL0797]
MKDQRKPTPSTIAVVVAALLLLLSLNHLIGNYHVHSNHVTAKPQRLVFLDLGANKGDSYEAMLGLGKKFNYSYACPPDRKPSDFEAHLFEANPAHNINLVKIRDQYNKKGNSTVFIYPSTVVYTRDEIIPFFVDTKNENKDFWGSSISLAHPDVEEAGRRNMLAVDIGRFILMNFVPSDFVVVKMDIEGAEYDILPHLLETGAYVNIDYIYVEYHAFALSADKVEGSVARLQAATRMMQEKGVNFPDYYSPARK